MKYRWLTVWSVIFVLFALGSCINTTIFESANISEPEPLIAINIDPYEPLLPVFEQLSEVATFSEAKPVQSIDALPVAFGDFNSDHFTDVFLLANGGHTIVALRGRACVDGKTIMTFFGSRNCLQVWHKMRCHFDSPIHNVVTSDFTGQKMLDLLVTTKSKDSNHYQVTLVVGDVNMDSFNCSNRITLLSNALTQPFVMDYNGDMITDFVVQTDQCRFQLWLGHDPSIPLDFECLTNMTDQSFASPHSNAFINLNSYKEDMTPDLFIRGESKIEYIRNIPTKGFSEKSKYDYPQGAYLGQSSFIDINNRGRMEHIIPVCVHKNSFSLCTEHAIMMLDPETKKWFNILSPEDSHSLGSKFHKKFTFAETQVFENTRLPMTFRVADINYDGYADLVTVLEQVDGHKTVAAIFLNTESRPENPTGRMFNLSWLSDETLDSVVLITLFDIYNNGRLNLLLTTDSGTELKNSHYDYYSNDCTSLYYSFLRVNVVSGLCTNSEKEFACPKEKELALGTNPYGPQCCFKGPLKGQHVCSAQLSQSAHFAMQLPFMVFGLGDDLNVVNELTVSIPNGNQGSRKRGWDENIPGSNLIVVPFPPNDPQAWAIRVYINMSVYSIVSIAFFIGLSILLVIIIYILHYRERREDRQDQKEYKNVVYW